jgi:predicted RNA binding protein YcfA (HicA-like mRNA interferase family)
MGKKEKLLTRLKQRPKDFTWKEMVNLLNILGYEQVKTGKSGGSRRRFIHPTAPIITLHRPHPNPIVKRYILKDIIELLKKEGFL